MGRIKAKRSKAKRVRRSPTPSAIHGLYPEDEARPQARNLCQKAGAEADAGGEIVRCRRYDLMQRTGGNTFIGKCGVQPIGAQRQHWASCRRQAFLSGDALAQCIYAMKDVHDLNSALALRQAVGRDIMSGT